MAEAIFHFNFGDFKCITFVEHTREVQAEKVFDSVPEDERNSVLKEFGIGDTFRVGYNVLLIDTGNEKILIDTGLGQGALIEGLAEEGITSDAINHIIITHGHGDHIGGIIDENNNLMFPNAHYWIGKTEWESWADLKNRYADLCARVQGAIPVASISFLDSESEFMAGFCPMFLPGHCIGMMGVLIESAGERLIHIADVMHHPLQVKYPDWCVGFDEDKPTARQTRRNVWDRAADENLLVVSYHVWKNGRGHVVADGDSWTWQAETT